METRKIASLGTAAGNTHDAVATSPRRSGDHDPRRLDQRACHGERWRGGSQVGQKIGLGYGATYPAVANTVEKYEVVTVTAVGKPGTQTCLAADAKAGDTNIRVMNRRQHLGRRQDQIGHRQRRPWDRDRHGHEGRHAVGVAAPAAVAWRIAGTGLDLAAPLKFNHSANIPFSVRGTGISFQPATAFAHSSNEPVQPLGTGITLDKPLANDHAINAVVRDAAGHDRGLPRDSGAQPVVRRPRPLRQRRQHGAA